MAALAGLVALLLAGDPPALPKVACACACAEEDDDDDADTAAAAADDDDDVLEAVPASRSV